MIDSPYQCRFCGGCHHAIECSLPFSKPLAVVSSTYIASDGGLVTKCRACRKWFRADQAHDFDACEAACEDYWDHKILERKERER